MNKEFKWDDEKVLEFVRFTLTQSPTFQGRYTDLEQFKESKQPNPEWEIWAYQHKQTKEVAPKGSMGFCKAMYNHEHEIYQVKRLSDGEVFTIGDISRNSYSQYTISGFKIIEGKLYAGWKEGGLDRLTDLRKVKEILFITEDGRPVYKDDKFYYVNKYFIIDEYWADNAWTPKEDGLEFSTEEKAQEYVLMNKPLFSVQEIHDFLSIELGNYNLLREKAKEKLNKP